MDKYFRDPHTEEGIHNIILQNRCGNRCTILCHEDHTELEFVYKPNAFRRKEFRARNFSTRDNFTTIFESVTWPTIGAGDVTEFGYDPFHTRLETESEAQAKNAISILNFADENAFAIQARCPLLIAIRPHQAFQVGDGLLTETFRDRGEEIVSFVAFPGFEANRYRVLDDGTHVIQLLEDDVAILGAEETRGHADRVIRRFRNRTIAELDAENEDLIARRLSRGKLTFTDPDWQKVFNVNQRMVFSGLDEGGACFGALNRIYHLIWVRDGSMSNSDMALAGNPDFIRIWAPFVLGNPAYTMMEDGSRIPEFAQLVGTRWSKSEDDGLFYATWSCYTHFQTTGDDSLLQSRHFDTLVECVDRHLDKCWDPERGIMGSDTIGEDPLQSSPYFGYDIVNGKEHKRRGHSDEDTNPIVRCFSLYHQVNTYNVLMMIEALLAQRPELKDERLERYSAVRAQLVDSLGTKFRQGEHDLYSMYIVFADGSDKWRPFGLGCDYWEHGWAVSQGPFFPLPELQLPNARTVVDTWDTVHHHGFCPWNKLARTLAEHGLDSASYKEMLQSEVDDAVMLSKRYCMPGALTEYFGAPEGWRGLPFSAGSFTVSAVSQLLQPQAMGLAVRGGRNLSAIREFQYKLSRINVSAEGDGDEVADWTLNGRTITASLQLPQDLLRPGMNELMIRRGPPAASCRIHGSEAELVSLTQSENGFVAQFRSPLTKQIKLQGKAKSIIARDAEGKELEVAESTIPETDITVLRIDRTGDVTLKISY